MNRKFYIFLLPIGLLLALLPCIGVAANISPEAVKALYVVQMQKFVTLSNPPRPVGKLCYYEKQPMPASESVGQQIEGLLKRGNNPSLTVKRFEAVGNFSSCDILYIPAEDADDISNILASIGNAPILTVSNAPRFILRGGMLGFIIDDQNHVKMEANLKNMNQKNVHMDAQLLELMSSVIN